MRFVRRSMDTEFLMSRFSTSLLKVSVVPPPKFDRLHELHNLQLRHRKLVADSSSKFLTLSSFGLTLPIQMALLVGT